MEAIEKLKEMVNKPFLYNNEEVVIINYVDNVGEDREGVEIYLNNGKVLEWNIYDLKMKLSRFRPLSNSVIVLANDRLNKVSTINPTVISNTRDLILLQIQHLKNNPDTAVIAQSKQIFQGVNTLINLAKTELDYRKYMNTINIEK